MKNRRFLKFFLAAIGSLSLLAAPHAGAQGEIPAEPDGLQLGELVTFSIQLMQKEQWQQALKFGNQAIKDEGDGALKQWGPLFGTIYYRNGICLMKLEKWGEAASAFEKCYKDFPNDKQAMNENEFEKRALFQWAKCEMKQEEWQKAIDLFQKFIKELEMPRDRFSRADYFISRAMCFYKLRQIVPGNQEFESALQNRLAYKVPDDAIIGCFLEMVKAALEKEDEQAIVDFIKKNRGTLLPNQDALYPHWGSIAKLANEALKADMDRAAVTLFQLLPNTPEAIEQIKDVINSMGKLPKLRNRVSGARYDSKLLGERLTKFEESMSNPQSVEIIQLTAMAIMHEREGNAGGAHSAYRMLENFYPHAEKREDNLFHLARTSFTVNEGKNALPDAKKFLAEFPNSKHVNTIKRLMFESLFDEQRYEECIESATQMIAELKPGTPEHDICLHVLGGSYFYTGDYETAAPLLEQHFKEYPESDRKLASHYFYAANPYRLFDINEAATRLDGFIEKHGKPEENPFLPFALLDRATCHYMNEENLETKQKSTRIIDEFKDHSITDQAYILRGNAEMLLEDGSNADAERDFNVGLELAQRWDHDVVAAEALFALADLVISEGEEAKDKERMLQAMPYINQFWEKYGEDSPFRRQFAVRQLTVFIEADRLDEALAKLQVIIPELAAADDITGLQKTLPPYREAYMLKHSADEFLNHFTAFPGVPLSAKAARALMAIEIIRVFEDIAKKAEEGPAKMAAEAAVKNRFAELKNKFAVTELAPSILIEVGDYLRTKTAAPREALPFYSEVLKRDDEKYRLDALLGRGFIYGLSPLPGELDKGLADYRTVIEKAEKDSHREEGLYHIVRLLMGKKDYAGAADKALEFLDKDNKFSKLRKAQVYLMLAQSYEQRGKLDDAINTYARVWVGHMGTIEASAPAMEGWMRILWQRNNPGDDRTMGDRQGAYEGGWKYIQQTGHFRDKMTPEDLELWLVVDKLMKQYEANPSITAMKVEEPK